MPAASRFGVYNCPNKKVDAVVAYTNTVPAGAFRGYGLPQTLFAVEAAIDELAAQLGIDPFDDAPAATSSSPATPCCRRRTTAITTSSTAPMGSISASIWSSARWRRRRSTDLPPDWLTGDGIALTMIDTVPPDGHIADAAIALRDDGGFALTVGTAEFGNGTSTVHRQIAATALQTTVDRISLRQSDTAHGGHDTGAYGSTGTFVAGRATQAAAEQSRGRASRRLRRSYGTPIRLPAARRRCRRPWPPARLLRASLRNCARTTQRR